ncbi:hypothetical protein DL764_009331 [Monosporascus ibericus]|uniref:Uncharacterized protein n=1 Tax=Monosporascus ibericus TaxID=155417 RepID=A0A4V1X905_9PEZI|nr:hypothetical protein DL764_009331 [Monosporascus ibericus]
MAQGDLHPMSEAQEEHEKANLELTRDDDTAAPTSSGRVQEPTAHSQPPSAASRSGMGTPPVQTAQQPLPQPYHQRQLPYSPYLCQPGPVQYLQAVRVLPPYSKSWTISKLVLTGLSSFWAVVILSLSLVFSVKGGNARATALYAAPVTIVALMWNGAELTTYFIRSRKGSDTRRGIHPGAHIGMHLCFWLACVFGIFLTLMIAISTARMIARCNADDDEDSYHDYFSSSYCEAYYYDNGPYAKNFYIPSLRAMLSMWCLALINHFVLFVLACIDTHQRNRLKPAGVAFAHPGTASYGTPGQGIGMEPVSYYPAPLQPAVMAPFPGPVPVGGAPALQGKTQVPPQNYQNLTGFYAPSPPQAPAQVPSPAAPSPVSPSQPTSLPRPSGSGPDEITPAPPGASGQ